MQLLLIVLLLVLLFGGGFGALHVYNSYGLSAGGGVGLLVLILVVFLLVRAIPWE